ncbi:MAG TPA: sensor histidine kinase [Streptosporangiaceae bacterium]|nr:sensor histidine kinase [Streptosporangiaceae bacterium]
MTVTRPDSGFDVWKRREDKALRVVPYVALAISTSLAPLVDDYGPWPGTAGTLLLAGLAAAWMLWMVTLHPEWPRRPLPRVVYYVGLQILLAALVIRNPIFGFFAFAGYVHAFLLPGRWKYAGVGATAMSTALSQVGGAANFGWGSVAPYVVIAAFNVAVAGAFTFFSEITDRQNETRKHMIAELAEANRRLEATMEENAGLQAQLLTQAREAGVAEERQRMAREIHDTLAQGLTGVVTQLQALELATDRPEEWRRHLDTAVGLARESLAEARRSVQAVGPEALERARLPEALAEIVERWSAINGVPAEIITTGTARPLHPEIEVTLLRTAQEALANAAKHAAASRVGLTLSYMEDVVTLDVRDDGVGGARAGTRAGAGGGFGLTAMRQRVDRLAGTLEIESEPGEGTAISASVPAIPAEAGMTGSGR